MYTIEYSKNFYKKCLADLPKEVQKKILNIIETRIAAFPHESGKLLTGSRKNQWSCRVGNYRILYQIFEDKIVVVIIKAGHRKNVYND